MAALKTLAYVIKTQDFRDTSLLATFYTQDLGKLKAVVKGVRDGRYRYGSTLEPFSLNEILVYRRRRGDLHLATAAELVERYDPLRVDMEKLGSAVYFLELVDQLTDDGQPNPEIFSLLGLALDFMAGGENPREICRIFEIKLVGYLGLMPELDRCVRCGTARSGPVYFSVPSGGVFCDSCRKKKNEYAFLLPEAALAFLDRSKKESFDSLRNLRVAPDAAQKAEKTLRAFLDYHLNHRPRALIFLEKIRNFRAGFQRAPAAAPRTVSSHA